MRLDARDAQEPPAYQPAIRVDGQGELAGQRARVTVDAIAVPLDPAVLAWDHRPALGVRDDGVPHRQGDELLSGAALLVRGHALLRHGSGELLWQPRDNQVDRSEEHTSELQSLAYLVCRLLLEKKKKT